MAGRLCYRCKSDNGVEEHHVIPKFLGKYFGLQNTDSEGRILLCGKCHNIITCLIAEWILKFFIRTTNPDEITLDDLKRYIKENTNSFSGGVYR